MHAPWGLSSLSSVLITHAGNEIATASGEVNAATREPAGPHCRRASIGVYTSAMRRTKSSIRSVRVGLLHRRKVLRLAAVLPWASLVAGCGQKGPLYHPQEPEDEDEDEDEQTSAAPRAPGSRLS